MGLEHKNRYCQNDVMTSIKGSRADVVGLMDKARPYSSKTHFI